MLETEFQYSKRTLTETSSETATLRILNINGQEVTKKEIRQISSDELASIPVGSLPAGLYLVQYQTADKVEKAKLVIERE